MNIFFSTGIRWVKEMWRIHQGWIDGGWAEDGRRMDGGWAEDGYVLQQMGVEDKMP